jgi:aspartyl-tRNA(Asn)/glutamyl-tRNA(Gln) amidotransferase subunit A
MIEHSLQAIALSLKSKEISSVELTQLYLDRIARHNPRLNAYLTVDPASSLGQAQRGRRTTGEGEGGPLTGIPIAHKDIFCAKGWLTTCGSKMLSNFVSPYDAAVIAASSRRCGVLGKTNMDEFAMGSSNETSFFGPVNNPWDTTAFPAVLPAARPLRSPRAWHRQPPAPTPAARFASRQPCAT